MALSESYEVRDPIHGLIRLTDLERRIIDTPTFQRLRRIRQLALADLVYPGAHHSRFEHLLGTVHVAARILQGLGRREQLSEDDIRRVRLAALLHDVGHGPFSHVSEHLLDKYYDGSKVGSASSREKIHEKVTIDIITKGADLPKVLTPEDKDGVVGILKEPTERSFLRDIVSSDLDADKMDYLLRDAYYAGVQYGHYDLEKVVEECRVERSGRESFLVVDQGGLFAVEQLVLAKHHMTQQVYAHRVRTITDLMIVRGLELAIEADESIRRVFAYDGTEDHLTTYLTMDDARISEAVLKSRSPEAAEIFRRLRDRRLFKEVSLIRLDEHDVPDVPTRRRLLNLSDDDRTQLEAKVADLIGCRPWEVVAYNKKVKNPAYQPPGGLGPEAIMIRSRRDGKLLSFNQFTEVVTASFPSAERLHIIAPLDGDLMDSGRRQEMSKQIEVLIFRHVGGHP